MFCCPRRTISRVLTSQLQYFKQFTCLLNASRPVEIIVVYYKIAVVYLSGEGDPQPHFLNMILEICPERLKLFKRGVTQHLRESRGSGSKIHRPPLLGFWICLCKVAEEVRCYNTETLLHLSILHLVAISNYFITIQIHYFLIYDIGPSHASSKSLQYLT